MSCDNKYYYHGVERYIMEAKLKTYLNKPNNKEKKEKKKKKNLRYFVRRFF